jgi:hypothetical protein
LSGRDFYLGKHGTSESRTEYDRLVAEWLANGRNFPHWNTFDGSDLTVNELLLAFVEWAERYYRKGGRETGEVMNIKYAVRCLRKLYGTTAARAFGPLQLKTVRQAIMDTGICRNEVNRRVRIIVRAFNGACRRGWSRPPCIMASKPSRASDVAVARFGRRSRSGRSRTRSLTPFVLTFPGRYGRWSNSNASRECGPARFAPCEPSTLTRTGIFGSTFLKLTSVSIMAGSGASISARKPKRFSGHGFDLS